MKSSVGDKQHQDGQQNHGGGENEGRGWVQVLYSANAKRRVHIAYCIVYISSCIVNTE